MPYQSISERKFRQRYQHANVRAGITHPYEVYAGDYLCAEGLTVASAFRKAWQYDQLGYIQPDPNEEQGSTND